MNEEYQETLEDVSHLPLVQRMQHKQMGNKEKGWADCAALLKDLPEGDPQFKEYSPLIKKTLKEKSPKSIILALSCLEPLIQGRSLDEAEYADLFGHMCANILNHANRNIAGQCRDVLNVCIEYEQHDALVESCVKTATSSKTPKVHEVNLAFLVAALKDYGPGVINLRKVKPVLALVTSANGNVRNECRNLIMEMYRWAKDDLKPLLKDLPEKNLPKESEFEALKDETPEAVKFTRAVQEARNKAISSGADPVAVVAAAPMANFSLVDPIDIFKKIPNLMKLLADKTELKVVLPTLRDTLEQNPLLLPNISYDELIKVLLNIAVNEAKFMLSVDSCKSLAQLALKVPNSVYSHSSKAIPELVKRAGFRQKALVDACNKAVDAMVPTVKYEKFLDLMVELVEDKRPDIIMEAGELIARSVPRCPENERPKKLPGGLVNALGKAFACSKPEARDAAMKASGALLKLTNDKALQAQVDKLDNPKKNKVNDFKNKCELLGGGGQTNGGGELAPSARSAVPAKKIPKIPSKESVASDASEQHKESSAPPTATRKPAGRAGPAKAATKASTARTGGGGQTGGKKKPAAAAAKGLGKVVFTENALSDEDLVTQLDSIAGESIRNQLSDSNYKVRLAACEELKANVSGLDDGTIPVQAITRILTKKPGLKDSNFQVLKVKIEILDIIFTRGRVSLHTLDACKADLTEKLGDLKNSAVASQALMSLAEATSLDLVSTQVLEAAFAQKSPKVQSEALNWTGQAIKEFGFKVPAKSVIETMKSALGASNPVVRTAAVKLFGVMYMYLKAPLRGFFENEKPAVLALLDQEIAAVQDQAPPSPVRGVKGSAGDDSPDGGGGGDRAAEDAPEEIDAADLVPRTDLSGKLQGAIIAEMCDTNWKVRLEALNKVQAIVSEASAITPDLGELPKALKARIGDTNKNLATIAMKLCQSLIEAMGPNGHKHSHVFLPAVMAALADSKIQVRLTAIACLDKWYELCRDPLTMFLDGDKMSDAFKSENPYLRSDLLDWFAGKLDGHKGKVNREFLNTCINPVFCCLEDRNGEVRKKAQACLLPLGKHTGFNALQARCNALPPSSKGSIGKQLEAIKAELAKSAPPPPQASAVTSSSTKAAGEKRQLPTATSNTATFTRKPSNLTKASRDAPEPDPDESSPPPREEKRPGKKGEEEMNPALLFTSRDLRQPATRKDPMMRWYIHDTKTLEKEKQELLGELKRMFEAAGASSQCVQLPFSEMLPHHQKITDIWIQALRDESTQDMMLANRDLIIRWGAVHCYDKNWMTINHFMRFLLELFPIMNEREISLETVEVNILLPNFLSKFVSMTAQSQELVDSVMRALPLVCKPSQIFMNVADMLKNQKNFKLAKNMIDELNKLMDEHRDEIRRLPNLRIVVKALSDLTKQANMKEASLRTIAELCYLKEGHKDQRDMMREISDKDRASIEKYMTKIREERPPPPPPARDVREAVTEPSSPARQLARPSAGGNSGGSLANRTITRQSGIGRGIPSPRGSLQFSPRTPPQHLQQQHMDHLNAVNNNAPVNHHSVHPEGHGPPTVPVGSFVDPCGTFVRTSGNNRSPLGLSRTIRQPSAPVRTTYDAENFERISRLADLALRKEEQTRLSGGPIAILPASISLGGGGLVPVGVEGGLDEHSIARKLNCTAVEDVILAGQQILMSLQAGEGDAVLPGVNEAYINSLFVNVGQQWNTVLTLYIPDDTSREEDIRQVIHTLGACVYTVITTGSYAKLASQAAIEALLPSAFQLLSHEFLEKFLKAGSTTSDVQKRLNDIIVKSLDRCNATRVTCALLRVYTDRVARKLHESDRNARTCLDLMTKCLWKLVRHWKQHLPDDLEVLPILRTSEHCLTAFAAMPIHACDVDKELRTVKSVVNELYSHHENKVLDETRLHFDPESEIYKTVMRAKRNKERSFKQTQVQHPALSDTAGATLAPPSPPSVAATTMGHAVAKTLNLTQLSSAMGHGESLNRHQQHKLYSTFGSGTNDNELRGVQHSQQVLRNNTTYTTTTTTSAIKTITADAAGTTDACGDNRNQQHTSLSNRHLLTDSPGQRYRAGAYIDTNTGIEISTPHDSGNSVYHTMEFGRALPQYNRQRHLPGAQHYQQQPRSDDDNYPANDY